MNKLYCTACKSEREVISSNSDGAGIRHTLSCGHGFIELHLYDLVKISEGIGLRKMGETNEKYKRGDKPPNINYAKKFGPQYRNDIPKLLELWPTQKTEKPFSWLTPVKDIIENDYILSANTYNPYSGEEEVNHRDPKEILRETKEKEKKMMKALDKIRL